MDSLSKTNIRYQLSDTVKLLKQKDILNIIDTTKQLIGHIGGISSIVKFRQTSIGSKHRLLITVKDDSSLEVTDGDCTR